MFDRRGTKRVGCHQERFEANLVESTGQFSQSRRFPNSINPYGEYDIRLRTFLNQLFKTVGLNGLEDFQQCMPDDVEGVGRTIGSQSKSDRRFIQFTDKEARWISA